MGLLDSINALISEHGSAVILRERLGLLKDQSEQLMKEKDVLQKAVEELKRENADLRAILPKKSSTDDFVDHHGMLFRRLPNGKTQSEVFCPDCRIPMTSLHNVLPYLCSKCRRQASFDGSKLSAILAELD